MKTVCFWLLYHFMIIIILIMIIDLVKWLIKHFITTSAQFCGRRLTLGCILFCFLLCVAFWHITGGFYMKKQNSSLIRAQISHILYFKCYNTFYSSQRAQPAHLGVMVRWWGGELYTCTVTLKDSRVQHVLWWGVGLLVGLPSKFYKRFRTQQEQQLFEVFSYSSYSGTSSLSCEMNILKETRSTEKTSFIARCRSWNNPLPPLSSLLSSSSLLSPLSSFLLLSVLFSLC